MGRKWLSDDDDDLHYTLDGVMCKVCGGPWLAHLEELYEDNEEKPARGHKWNATTGKREDQ